MKPERRIEKFLRRIDVIPDAERKRLRLEELLEVRDKTKKSTSADVQPTIRRLIMNRQIWKIAASLVVAATVIGVIGILQNGGQTAYAFEQTVAAMQGKRFFHIQTYYASPTKRHDEFWAEFNEHGKVIRLRQLDQWAREDNPIEVIWEHQVKYQYEPQDEGTPGILLISNKEHHVDEGKLEGFDPETIIEEFNEKIENGEATIEVDDSLTQDGNIVVESTQNRSRWLRVFVVDPETKLVLRMDEYRLRELDDEGNEYTRYLRGFEVLEYNQPFDPNLFQPNFPDDTIIVDQTSGDVGMAQGDLSDKEVASEIVRQALEAWSADDYETAGLLFGGAPKEFFMQHAPDKPIDDIVVEEPEFMPLEHDRPRFKVICRYVDERQDDQRISYFVTTVAGQPGRWFITPIKL